MKRLFALLLLSLLVVHSYAQKTQFTATVDTNRILIGQQITLTLSGEMAKGTSFKWPILPDTLSGLQLINTGKLDTIETKDGQWKLQQKLKLTSFDSGYAAIPPLALKVSDQTIRAEAIAVAVGMPQVKEDNKYYDIKEPLEPPFDWGFWLMIAAGVIILGGIIALIIYFISERKRKKKLTPEQVLSPYEYALKQMRDLEAENLWQAGEIKEYYSRLTDIMRLYMERQMGFNAMESTADEVIDLVSELHLPKELYQKVAELMRLSVMIKYAREKATPEAHDRSLATVKEFLDTTKPVEIQEDHADVPV